MNLIVLTEPPVEPVSLEELYSLLRLDPEGSPPEHPDDDMLRSQIVSARQRIEAATRRALVQQTVRLVLPRFPFSRVFFGDSIAGYASDEDCFEPREAWFELPKPPLIAIEAIRYYDSANALQTLDASTYFHTDTLVPQVHCSAGNAWPMTYPRDDAVRVDYVVGYTPNGSPPDDYVANIPASLKNAVKLEVQLQYDELAPDKRSDIEKTIDRLIATFRIHKF